MDKYKQKQSIIAKKCNKDIIQLSRDWWRLGDQEECVWGSLAAAAGILLSVSGGYPGSSRGPVSCWRETQGSAAGSLGPACPASSGPAELWLQAGCCSSLCKRSDQAAEQETIKVLHTIMFWYVKVLINQLVTVTVIWTIKGQTMVENVTHCFCKGNYCMYKYFCEFMKV